MRNGRLAVMGGGALTSVMSALVQLVDLHGRSTPPRYACAGPVGSLRLRNTLLELITGFLRRGTPRLHRAVDLLPLHVERMSSGIDLIFDATARILKGVDDRIGYIVRHVLGRASNAARTPPDVAPRRRARTR